MEKIRTKHFDEPKLLETCRRWDGYKGLEKALAMAPADVAVKEVKR